MKLDKNDEQIIKALKQLPKIEDQENKDELFQRISAHTFEKKQQKHYRFAPILTTLIVTALIITVIPLLTDLGLTGKSLNDSAGNVVQESSQNFDLKMYDDAEVNEAEISVMDHAVENYVLQDIDDLTVIYGAVADDQVQTVIPITIITTGTDNLNTHYNQLDKYLETIEWGVKDDLFEHVHVEIDIDNHKVFMSFSDEFSLGEGSANPAMFVNILTAMFVPYQIEKVVFDKEIDLGPIGNVSELPLQRKEKENYKMFQAGEHRQKFLVPIKTEDDVTIEEAIQDMKNGQPSFNIYPTIPEEAQFSFTSTGEELIISIQYDQILEDIQEATIMIEAILMTAKSFGYEQVTFKDMPVNQIGSYHFSESITVPEAINPIYR